MQNGTKANHDRVVLITGASSGIGQACASYLHQRGYRVYGTSRRAPNDPVTDGSFTLIQMDIDDDASVARGIDYVMARAGRLDVVVNNAGIGLAGAIEDTSIQEAQAVLETNFFGTLRVCRAVLPSLRKQHGGTIVNISSIGGQISLPYQAIYSASKLAVEGLSQALRIESKPYGIRVVVILPGDFRTDFTRHRSRTAESAQHRVHRARFDKALAVMEHDELHGASPAEIARLLERIIHTRSPHLQYTTGPLIERLALRLKPFIPARLFEWAITRYYQLNTSAGTQASDLETGNNCNYSAVTARSVVCDEAVPAQPTTFADQHGDCFAKDARNTCTHCVQCGVTQAE